MPTMRELRVYVWPPSGPLRGLFWYSLRVCLAQIKRLVCFTGIGRCEMPRFYFHTMRGQITVLDQEGIDLPDRKHAEEEAARRAQAIVAGEVLKGVPPSSGKIIVADDSWQTVFEFSF